MNKYLLIISLVFISLNTIFAQQRMRLSKGNFKLSKTTQVPANCVDRDLSIPEKSDIFEITTNSIFLKGNAVPRMGLEEAIKKGIVEITGNGTTKGVNVNLLKPAAGYDEIVVESGAAVIGGKNQNFDNLDKLTVLEDRVKLIDEKYAELVEKFSHDHPLTTSFEREKYDIDGMFTDESYSIDDIKIKIDNLSSKVKKEEDAYALMKPNDYVFVGEEKLDIKTIKNRNIVIDNPHYLTKTEMRQIAKVNKSPFVFSREGLLKNIALPKEKLKFIVVGSDDVTTNMKLYGQNNMESFTDYVRDIKNNAKLSPYFEFVSQKEALQQSLERNKDIRTITLYHNEGDMLFGEHKSSFAIKDRLTCNSFQESFLGNSLESVDFIDPEDAINSFANLIKNNPDKNEFQILDFYKKFADDYTKIRVARGNEEKLLTGGAIIVVTGTGAMIVWTPVGDIAGHVKINDGVETDSTVVHLVDSNWSKVESTTVVNGEFLFKDVLIGTYYLSVEGYSIILDGGDTTPEDNNDEALLFDGSIYVNLENNELDADNNFKINKN